MIVTCLTYCPVVVTGLIRSLAHAGKAVTSLLIVRCIVLVMIRPWFRQEWCLLIVVAASSWVDEFIQRYEAQGLGLWDELDSDWVRRTQEYGIRRPTQDGRIFVYRAFDLWSHTGPFYRATVVVHQVMLPDEILWRIALRPDLGHDWNRVGWRLVPVDDSRSSSCLPDLISPTYVLVMHGLLEDMAHRPHGLLEITSGDACHVRATVLPSRINLSTRLANGEVCGDTQSGCSD